MKDLNFFKPYIGQNKEKINAKIYVYGATITVVALIIISFGVNTARMYLLDRSINDYRSKLEAPEIQEKLKDAENVNKEISVLKQYDTSLTGIAISVKKRNNVSDTLLKNICSTMPSQVSFNSLNIVENNISIKGISTERTAIAELKHNLSELSIMEDVYVNSIDEQNTAEGGFSFDIKCVLKGVE